MQREGKKKKRILDGDADAVGGLSTEEEKLFVVGPDLTRGASRAFLPDKLRGLAQFLKPRNFQTGTSSSAGR